MATVSLQSKAHRDLLDIIDKLRAQGISRYVDLPEIIVTGDQSAGKSSVLEAISGMSFPTKDNLCTRFATELILRRSPNADVKVSIVPDTERTECEQDQLKVFAPTVDLADPQLGAVIEGAKEAMGLNGQKNFSNDILRVEMSGPEQPHLTMVDLPGLFQAGNSTQSDEDAELVTNMVVRYMKRPRSIILAVVSAKSDFALQKVTRLARELDPNGVRTLGLITKPDTLDQGSDSEAAYIHLAQNKDVKFRLGWHVLKNRDYQMRNATSAERGQAEIEFFSRGAWTQLESSHLGVAPLKPRLSNLLKDQILLQLPSLLSDITDGIASCKEKLKKLGASRGSVREQRRYLLATSQSFSRLMQAAVDGIYSDGFFGSAKSGEGYERRLRAVVQNILTDFRDEIHKHGRSRRVLEDLDDEPEVKVHGDNIVENHVDGDEIHRRDYVKEIKGLIRRNRGCELPGTFNPLIVSELFTEQSRPWTAIAMTLKYDVLRAVTTTSLAILRHVAIEETAEKILSIINLDIGKIKADLDSTFEQVLHSYLHVHPITYNHYLTSNVQKAQKDRRVRQIAAKIRHLNGGDFLRTQENVLINENTLRSLLEMCEEQDMDLYGSSLALDYMEAYYKVALKRFVDDISTLAIECSLLRRLPNVFNADMIHDMSDEEVSRLAADNEDDVRERALQKEKLTVLETALYELKRLNSFRSVTSNDLSNFPFRAAREVTLKSLEEKTQAHEADVDELSEANKDAAAESLFKDESEMPRASTFRYPDEPQVQPSLGFGSSRRRKQRAVPTLHECGKVLPTDLA